MQTGVSEGSSLCQTRRTSKGKGCSLRLRFSRISTTKAQRPEDLESPPSTTVLGVVLTTVRTSYLVASSSCNSRSACTQSEVSSPRIPKLLRRSPIKYARS